MDFLNRSFAQFKELWEGMTPAARITSGLLLGVIVVSLAYLLNHQSGGADSYLLGGRPFTANELPAIEAAFEKAGLHGAVIEGNRIKVPSGQETAYVGAMADAGALPMDFHEYFEKTLSNLGPFVGPKQREELIKNAKQRELADIIRAMPGVESAAVHYDKQREPGLSRKWITTASVTVQPVMGQTLDAARAKMISRLVSASIAGMKPGNVTVADLNGQVYGGEGDEPYGEGADHEYIKVMAAWQSRIESMLLGSLPTIENMRLGVNVVLDREVESTERSVKFDDKLKGTRQVQSDSSEETIKSSSPGGRPGVEAQQPRPNQPTSLASTERTQESNKVESKETVISDPGETLRQSRTVGLVPKHITVALSVPSTYFEAVWAKENPAPEGQTPQPPGAAELAEIESREMKKLQQHAAQLVALTPDTADVNTLVKVTSFPFLKQDELPGLAASDLAVAWFSRHWSTLGLLGLGAFSLMMLRSMIKSVPQPQRAATEKKKEEGEQDEEEEDSRVDVDGKSMPRRLQRRRAAGGSLREELSEIVKEDPAVAATIIRGWIGSSAKVK